MASIKTKSILLAVVIALGLIAVASLPAFARADDENDGGHSSLYIECHDGIDNDHDGYIDLLDSDCAQFRPACGEGQHSDEQFNCVPNDEGDPVCDAPQVLLNHECVDPQPLQCDSPQVPNDTQTACVDPAPTCVGGQTLQNNQCVDPTCTDTQTLNADTHTCVDNAPVCVGGQTLVNNQCVDPTCTENQTLDTEAHICVNTLVVPTCTEAQHLENNVCIDNAVTPSNTSDNSGGGGGGGGGGNGPIAGSFAGGGGSIVPGGNVGNGPIAGSVLGASTSSLPELPAGCSPMITNYMRMSKHNDPDQVKTLQEFLNKELGLKIEVTGFFGRDTDAGVRQFQLAHVPQILTPWGITDATGYVYKTTSRWINLMSCTSLDIPMPQLP